MRFLQQCVLILLSVFATHTTTAVVADIGAVVVDIGKVKYALSDESGEATAIGVATDNSDWDDLEIPDDVTYCNVKYPVTAIADNAFYEQQYFTGSLIIGNNITSIGDYAFCECYGFTGLLTIPKSVTSIGNYAFYGCSGFNGSLTIGDNVTSIGYRAFYACSGFIGSLTIPETVTSIGSYAFGGCRGFTGSLTIGNNVTSIGEFAFYYCNGFTGSLTIGDNVTSIGSQAFQFCSGFTGSLTIPESVTSIGLLAFSGCSGFTGSLTIPESVTSIDTGVFSGCRGFTGSLTIPESVTSIGNSAFSGCSGFIGSLTIPESVTSIGNSAFYGCSGLSGTLYLGKSVKTIYSNAFSDINGFDEVILMSNSQVGFFSSSVTCSDVFSKDVIYGAILRVPSDLVDTYRASSHWGAFANIYAIEELTAMSFAETSVEIEVGQTQKLKLNTEPQYAWTELVYSTSDAEVATVSESGQVKGIAPGTATVTATSGEISATCEVTVLPESKNVQGVDIKALKFYVGESVTICAAVQPEDAAEQTIGWSSDAPEVAAVDADGTVWFNGEGEAVVTAECSGFTTSMTFRVEAVEAQALNVFPAEAVGAVGSSLYLLALHTPDNTTDKSVSWESSNPDVAAVDADGRVNLLTEGQTVITATSGAYTATSVVTVNLEAVSIAELSGEGVAIRVSNGGIDILNAPEMARVIVSTVDGKVVTAMYADSAEIHIPLSAGIYIVKVGTSTTAKILI